MGSDKEIIGGENGGRQTTVRRLRNERYLTFENVALWVFLVTNLGMYYPMLLPLVWLGYLLAFAALGLRLYKLRGIPLSTAPFIGISALYVLFCYMSVFWAFNPEFCMDSDGRLLRTVLMSWVVCILVKTRRQWHMAMVFVALAAVINGLLYLQFVDLTKLAAARFNSQLASNVDGLPHLNVVAMYVAFAAVYFMSELTDRRNKPNWVTTGIVVLMIVAMVLVFLFGSRKSILTVVSGIFLYIMAASSGMRKLQMACLAAIVVCLLIAILPPEYIEFVIKRLFGTFDSEKHLAPEDRFRLRMIENAGEYIAQSPIVGHGFYNFSELFGRDTGTYLYAHNNILETLTDGGIIGFTIYYSIYFIILRNWYLTRKSNPSMFLVAVFMTLILLNGFLIVYLSEQFIWIMLSLMYIGSRGFRSDADEKTILGRRVRKVKARKQFPAADNVNRIG